MIHFTIIITKYQLHYTYLINRYMLSYILSENLQKKLNREQIFVYIYNVVLRNASQAALL